ncbi:MAG: Ldh family oxidoreductase, partial [Alphaproteobacteria bacterium]|nr:Ldh family oxidoreductase [Alphaproteobacteria bacterium]
GAKRPVFCTNPMAFAAPQADGPPLLIDQSSSATAYVNIRSAAERGEDIPLGWAIDKDGQPTTDPRAALAGTMLAFGGARGANIALMVDVLAAGLSGANWSLDAPPFDQGDQCPASGLFVLAINPLPGDENFSARLAAQSKRLSQDYGVHIPGLAKAKARQSAANDGMEIDDALIARLQEMVG